MTKLVMVIDDDAGVLQLFAEILEEEGYRYSLHNELSTNLNTVEKLKPDLVILDLLFGSELGGWQLLQKMRLRRATATIPVILCTAEANRVKELADELKAKRVRVVLKPFDLAEIIAAIEQTLDDKPVTWQWSFGATNPITSSNNNFIFD